MPHPQDAPAPVPPRVHTRLQAHAHMVHAWPLLPVPEAQAARRQRVDFLRR